MKITLFNLLIFIFITTGHANTLVLYSDDGPPHMIKATNSGIDIDIARAVLNEMGYQVKIRYSSLARGKLNVEKGAADAVTPTFFEKDRDGFYVSDATVTYKPTVFTLKKNNLRIHKITDLIGHDIMTFQGATGYFGPDFVHVSKNTPYNEHYKMNMFPKLLLEERYSVIVLDYYIFNYFYRIHDKTRDLSVFEAHSVIPPVKASVGFHDKELRNRFNIKLAKYLFDKRDIAVIEKYIGR